MLAGRRTRTSSASPCRSHLVAPQRLGPALRRTAPRRGDPRRQPQRARRRRVPTERQRHPAVGEPFGLVHEQCPHPHVERQPRDRVGKGEAAAHVHAGTRLRVAAVAAQTHLGVGDRRPPPRMKPRKPRNAVRTRVTPASEAFSRPVGPSSRSLAAPTHSASALNAREKPPAAREPDQLAPRPHRRHHHRHARLEPRAVVPLPIAQPHLGAERQLELERCPVVLRQHPREPRPQRRLLGDPSGRLSGAERPPDDGFDSVSHGVRKRPPVPETAGSTAGSTERQTANLELPSPRPTPSSTAPGPCDRSSPSPATVTTLPSSSGAGSASWPPRGSCRRRSSRHARSPWVARRPPAPTGPARRPTRATPRSRTRRRMPATRPATPGTGPAAPGASAPGSAGLFGGGRRVLRFAETTRSSSW